MYYKVLSVPYGRPPKSVLPTYISSVMHSVYKVGIPTKAVIGKLFIFRTLNDAIHSSIGCNIITIYACNAENVTECKYERVPNIHYANDFDIQRFWQGEYYDKDTWPVPEGTLLADSVTLLYRVNRCLTKTY